MNSLENIVGRLIEIRIATPLTTNDVRDFALLTRRVVSKRSESFVCCSDLRGMNVLAPGVAEQLLAVLKVTNPHIERDAFMTGTGAVQALQTERLIRESGHSARRSFRDIESAKRWLGEVLDAAERKRLAEFFSTTAPTG